MILVTNLREITLLIYLSAGLLRQDLGGEREEQLRADLRASGRAAGLRLPAEHGHRHPQDVYHAAGDQVHVEGGAGRNHLTGTLDQNISVC